MNTDSDKFYWHQYMPEYERHVFQHIRQDSNILEFGVWKGQSIEFFWNRFTLARIYGVDIFDSINVCPRERFTYIKQDQGKRSEVRDMFKKLNIKFDLIIDDGSHEPRHQADCLIEGFKYVRSQGFYIVEDIHTAFRRLGTPTIFHVLMMIQHMKATNSNPSEDIVDSLDCYFTRREIYDLFYSIEDLGLIRRSHLPLKCWNCGTSNFDYVHLKCRCGEDLYKEADSMSFIIQKK